MGSLNEKMILGIGAVGAIVGGLFLSRKIKSNTPKPTGAGDIFMPEKLDVKYNGFDGNYYNFTFSITLENRNPDFDITTYIAWWDSINEKEETTAITIPAGGSYTWRQDKLSTVTDWSMYLTAGDLVAVGVAEVTDPAPALVHGKIINSETGLPIEDCKINLYSGYMCYSNENGEYAIIKEYSPGTYRMSFQKEGYVKVDDWFELHEGENTINVSLEASPNGFYVPPIMDVEYLGDIDGYWIKFKFSTTITNYGKITESHQITWYLDPAQPFQPSYSFPMTSVISLKPGQSHKFVTTGYGATYYGWACKLFGDWGGNRSSVGEVYEPQTGIVLQE